MKYLIFAATNIPRSLAKMIKQKDGTNLRQINPKQIYPRQINKRPTKVADKQME